VQNVLQPPFSTGSWLARRLIIVPKSVATKSTFSPTSRNSASVIVATAPIVG